MDRKSYLKNIQEAFEGLGADAFRQAIMDMGSAQLTMAVSTLFQDKEWVDAFFAVMKEPQHTQIQVLCKIMDKLVPNIQAIKAQVDVPDQLVVIYQQPDEEDSQTPTNT